MGIYKVSASEGLWNISGGCGCGPEFMGIRSQIEADSCEDAIKKTLLFMDCEWNYDLGNEWIQVEGDEGMLRHTFTVNPEYTNYVGRFTRGSKMFVGEIDRYTDQGDEEIPLIDELIFLKDTCSGDYLEWPISRYMPDYVLDSLFDN